MRAQPLQVLGPRGRWFLGHQKFGDLTGETDWRVEKCMEDLTKKSWVYIMKTVMDLTS